MGLTEKRKRFPSWGGAFLFAVISIDERRGPLAMSICPRIRDRRRIRPAAEARVGQETEAQNDLRSSYISLYRLESDEQIYQRLRCLAAELGRPPNKADVPGFDYIKSRLGSWPRILELAGVKPVGRRRWYGLEQGEQERIEKPQLK
jgi:hypothetical protein